MILQNLYCHGNKTILVNELSTRVKAPGYAKQKKKLTGEVSAKQHTLTCTFYTIRCFLLITSAFPLQGGLSLNLYHDPLKQTLWKSSG